MYHPAQSHTVVAVAEIVTFYPSYFSPSPLPQGPQEGFELPRRFVPTAGECCSERGNTSVAASPTNLPAGL